MALNYEDAREFVRISIWATVDRFIIDIEETIDKMAVTGMSINEITATLQSDLDSSGRLFGSLASGTASLTRNGVETIANVAANEVFEGENLDRRVWKTAGVNVCSDCEARAGITGTIEYFETIGMPKSGFSVCRENCQCQLAPIGYTAEGDIIIKEKK